MRIVRPYLWVYPAVILAIGIGFLIWSYFQAADADAYRNANQCGAAVTPHCYEVFRGVIASVEVNQTRSGERDLVVIKTETAGNLTANLEPTASSAPHVRTGANVTVLRYRGEVTLVTVDGYAVASTANPAATQSDTTRYGWFFTGLGAISAGYVFYARRRRNRLPTLAGMDAIGRYAAAQPGILPSGSVGWSVSPTPSLSAIGRYAIGTAAIILLTLRALFDPARAMWALLFDSSIVLAVLVALFLFYRNARVFADKDQVAKVGWFGRTKSLPLRDVRSAERFSVANRYGAVKHLVFVGSNGRKAFEIAGIAWNFDRLDALCMEAGIQLGGSYDDAVSGFRINSRVPGTTRWGQQLLWGGGLIIVIVLLVVLVAGPTQR